MMRFGLVVVALLAAQAAMAQRPEADAAHCSGGAGNIAVFGRGGTCGDSGTPLSGVSGTLTFSPSSLPATVGPCDIIASAGQSCVAAHSVTRRLLGAYAGPLFQLSRASDQSTQDIGTTASGLVDLSPVAAFCNGTDCYFSAIYDQTGNRNVLPQADRSSMAPYWLSRLNGLPVVITSGNNANFRNRTSTQGIPPGAASASVYEVEQSNVYSSCCGGYGRMETNPNDVVPGTMWATGFSNHAGIEYFGIDVEASVPGIFLAHVPDLAMIEARYTGDTGLMTLKVWNATAAGVPIAQSGMPWTDPYGNKPPVSLIVQSGISLGEGGDTSAAPQLFQEGAIIAGSPSDTTDAAVQANVAAFYASRSGFYLGPVDSVANTGCAGVGCSLPSILWCSDGKPNCLTKDPSPVNYGAWGLRRLRASYLGYAATIRRGDNGATRSVGFTASGDFDDATAQPFCAATTCYITTLFNQTVGHQGNDAQHPLYDLSQAVSVAQPQLAFNAGPNARTVMRFAGSQFLYSDGGVNPQTRQWTIIAISERTGGTAQVTYAAAMNASQGSVGYAASADTVDFVSNGAGPITATASDGAWHMLAASVTGGQIILSVDNRPGIAASDSGSGYAQHPFVIGAGAYYAGGWHADRQMTGYIAEVLAILPDIATAQSGGLDSIYDNAHRYYGGAF